jgi:quercetin dioxygenase-like cupin family protein
VDHNLRYDDPSFVVRAGPCGAREDRIMPSTPSHHLEPDLARLIEEVPADSIVSRRLPAGDGLDVTLFGFAPGQELSEHTSSRTAVMQVLEGTGTFAFAGEVHEVGPGAWAFMRPHTSHAITARTRLTLLLTMWKDRSDAAE